MRILKITQSKGLVLYNLEIIHNGIQGGDAGHGGFVVMSIRGFDGTLYVNGRETIAITIRVEGDAERQALIDICSSIIDELENNPKVL
jgi:hypothetical protein